MYMFSVVLANYLDSLDTNITESDVKLLACVFISKTILRELIDKGH